MAEAIIEGVIAILDGMRERNNDPEIRACIAALERVLELIEGDAAYI